MADPVFPRNSSMAFNGQRSDAATAENQVKLTNLGLQGLDYVLGGGLPEDSLYLLMGAPGTHYTTFANEAIYNHLSQGGKAVIYSSELPTKGIEEDFLLYGWKIRKYIDDRSLVVVRPFPPQLRELADLSEQDPMEERVHLSSAAGELSKDFVQKAKEGRWSVISPSYLMSVYPAQTMTDLVLTWVSSVHRYGGVHFISLLSGVHDDKHVNLIKNVVDGVLTFRYFQGYGQAEGEVEVEKLRKVLPRSKVFRHTVQGDGLVIETTARIG